MRLAIFPQFLLRPVEFRGDGRETIVFAATSIAFTGGISLNAGWGNFLRSEVHCAMVVPKTPRIEIEYCTQCRWLLRAAWVAQELLTTFPTEIGELALVPGTGGIFEVRVDDDVIWSRAHIRRFPELKELKQLLRDRIAPNRDLGHSDR
jgi:selenoprotein W-related protein